MFRPYYLAVDVLSALLRSEPDGGRSALEALGVSDAERLFSVIEQGDSGAPNEPAKREAIFQSVVRLLARVLAGQPLVLLVDDAHLADEATLLLLRVLVESEGVSLLVCAAAPKLEGGDATPLERFLDTHQGSLPLEQVELGPLTAADVGDHLRAIFPQVAIPEGFERELAEATQGNALFLGEILRKLVQDGKIRLRAHQWVIDPLEDGYLPRSLEDIVREKIAALDEEGRDLLGHASVLGESLPVSELVGGSECPEGRVLEFVDRAAALGLVTTEFDRDDETVRFLGKRVLEIAYGSLDPERREVLHERVGDYHESIYKSQSLLPPASILAYHFKRSASQEKSRYYVELQARHSRAIFDPEEAAHYSAELEDDAYTGPPLAVESAAAVPGLLRALLTAVRKVKLYPSSSEALRVAFGQVEAALAPILAKNELLDVHCVDDELRVNGEPLSVGDLRLVASGLGDLLRRLELRGLSLHRGIAPGEIQTLVRAFGETRPEAIDPRFWERFGAEQGLAHVNLKQLRYKAVAGSSAEPAPATTRDPDAPGVREVVRALVALGRGVLLYPVQSQVITGTIERIDEALTGLLADYETLSLAVADDAVLVDGMPSEASRFDRLTAELLELFEAVGLDSLHFRRGVLRAELEALVVGLREFPRDCGDEDFWPAFAEGRGLTRIAFNASRYATGVASTLVEVRVPPAAAEAPGALPEPEPAPPEETLDELLPELTGRVRERLLANDAAGVEQLAARVFADFERLETLRREKILVSWRAAGLSLEIGLQRDLAAALAPPLLAALVAERDPGVLREAAALLHPLTETLIQLRE